MLQNTCLWAITALLSASSAWAQIPESPGVPPEQRPGGDVYIPWLVVLVLTAIVCFAAWKSSGRTHQD